LLMRQTAGLLLLLETHGRDRRGYGAGGVEHVVCIGGGQLVVGGSPTTSWTRWFDRPWTTGSAAVVAC
jgi:hypothetical protein